MHRDSAIFVSLAAFAGLLGSFFGQRACRPVGDQRPLEAPERIVALSPGVAEILFALGCGPRVVGITDHTTFPPTEVQDKARVGGFLTPSLETVLALNPDLVVCRASQPELARRLRRAGLHVLAVRDRTLSDLVTSVIRIGAAVGRTSRAEQLAASLRLRFQEIRERARRTRQVSVLLAVGRADETLRAVYAASRRTLLGELLELAGGRNVVGDSAASFPLVSREAIAASDPEVVVEIVAPPSPFSPEEVRRSWSSLPNLRAVRSGRVYVIEDDAWLVPGPRLTRVAEKLYALLHGDQEDQ